MMRKSRPPRSIVDSAEEDGTQADAPQSREDGDVRQGEVTKVLNTE